MAKHKMKGVVIRYGDSATPTDTMPQLAEVSFDAGAWDFETVHAHDDGDTRVELPTLKAPPTLDISVWLDPADTAHDWVIDTHAAGTLAYIDFQLPVAGNNPDWEMSGYLEGLTIGGLNAQGYQQMQFSYRAAAAPTYTQDNVT